MELKIETFDDSFVLDGQSFSGSSRGSFSSSSSTCDPYTPISGRSSPRQGLNFDMSFGTDGLPTFDMTPPPSAASGYFPTDLKPGMDLDFMANGLHATPRGYATSPFDGTMPPQASLGYMTPQHRMDMSPFSDGLDHSMFMVPTPAHSIHGATVGMSELCLMQPVMESPMALFESKPPMPRSLSLVKGEDQQGLYQYNAMRRLYFDEAQQKSSALQKQLMSNGAPRGQPKREKSSRSGSGLRIPVATSGKHPCDHPDCNSRPFKRLEHLKRHKKTHDPNAEFYACKFCQHKFKSRKDNWRQHVKLHSVKGGKNSRVKFFPEAQAVYDEEMRKLERTAPSKPKRKAAS